MSKRNKNYQSQEENLSSEDIEILADEAEMLFKSRNR